MANRNDEALRAADALIAEYRTSMAADVLHQWAVDAVEALRELREATPRPEPAGRVKYRLLEEGEVIERTDEHLSDDAVTWVVLHNRIGPGLPYRPGVFMPVRRRLAAHAPQEGAE